MKISVAIPTYKRPEDIRKCVASIVAQTLSPSEVIIIDDDELPNDLIEDLRRQIKPIGAELIYHKKNHETEPRGLSLSRHIALAKSKNDLLIIDDDIVLEPECLEWMAKAKQESADENTIGIAGAIRNNRRRGKLEKLFGKIFLHGSKNAWDVNDFGFQSWDDHITERQVGYYVHSGFCLYDCQKALKVKFPVFQGGRPGLCDVHFSAHAKRLGYNYIIEPRAGCNHYHSSGGRDSEYEVGFREGYNRKVIYHDHCPKTFMRNILFYWASLGWSVRQLLVGHFAKGTGIIAGFLSPIKK